MNINNTEHWVKLHVKSIYSDLWQDKNAWRLFTVMLICAHYDNDFASIRFKGEQRYLKAGQFSASRKELSELAGLTEVATKNAIKRLKTGNRMSSETDNKTTIFTVVNWEKYQGDGQRKVQQNVQPESNQSPAQQGAKRNKDIKNITTNVVKSDSNEIRQVYSHYIKAFNKNPNQYKLSDKRRSKIRVRLRDAGLDMLLKAITNTSESEWHRGDNDRGWEADLDFIIRSYENVERLARLKSEGINNRVWDYTMEER